MMFWLMRIRTSLSVAHRRTFRLTDIRVGCHVGRPPGEPVKEVERKIFRVDRRDYFANSPLGTLGSRADDHGRCIPK